MQIDRTSCTHFSANQLRVLLTAAAYVLMQELRLRAARTACARTQVSWLRDRLLKLGVHVVRSARRLVLHLPRATPHLDAWRHIALELRPIVMRISGTGHVAETFTRWPWYSAGGGERRGPVGGAGSRGPAEEPDVRQGKGGGVAAGAREGGGTGLEEEG